MDKIFLSGLEFYAFHGVLPEENKIGCKYIVDVELYTNLQPAVKSDNIADTINYREVYGLIRNEMNNPSKLIEHVAGRIIDSLLQTFVTLDGLKIKISKMNPPVGGKLISACVELESWRNK